MNFPAQLKRLRERARLTQADVAVRAGVSIPRISEAENGKPVMLDTALKLVAACGGKLVISPRK